MAGDGERYDWVLAIAYRCGFVVYKYALNSNHLVDSFRFNALGDGVICISDISQYRAQLLTINSKTT